MRERPRFSLVVRVYFWIFLFLITCGPLVIVDFVAEWRREFYAYWAAALLWALIAGLLLWYAKSRCSSEQMDFWDGMLWVTASMMTGWTYMSFMTALPATTVAFAGAISIAVYGDLRLRPEYAQSQWILIVSFFYRNRMLR